MSAAVYTINGVHIYMAAAGEPDNEDGGVSSLSDAATWLEAKFSIGSYTCAWIACMFDNGLAILDDYWPDGAAGAQAIYHYTVTGGNTLASLRVEVRRLDKGGVVLYSGPIREGVKWEKKWGQDERIAAAPPPRIRVRR